MTPLRQQMIEAMQVRGFSPRTHESYLRAVTDLARYTHRSPDRLELADIQRFFIYLVTERHLADASCRLYLAGLRFLYLQVLHWPTFDVPIPHPKRVRRIPQLLTRAEVARILAAAEGLERRVMLATCYGCGLRVSELIALRIRNIDGERRLLHVERGKGGKDRKIVLSAGVLALLRDYWRRRRPRDWLFPSHRQLRPRSPSFAQRAYTDAKRAAGIDKIGGIHALRHAYATHQLAAGLPVHQLQYQLGHSDIHATLRYVHWVPNYREDRIACADLLGDLAVEDV